MPEKKPKKQRKPIIVSTRGVDGKGRIVETKGASK